MAAACFAYRANGGSVVRSNNAAYTYVNENGVSVDVPEVWSNKILAQDALAQNIISQADKDEAALVIQSIQGQVTMALLSGKKVSDFVKELAKVLEEESVPLFRLGLLVYAPNVYYMAKAKEDIVEKTTECLYTSQPLGSVGATVTIDFTLIETKYVQKLGCHSVFGKDDAGNLVQFLTKHEHLCRSGKRVGKIKNAAADKWHSGALVNFLNYVKAA